MEKNNQPNNQHITDNSSGPNSITTSDKKQETKKVDSKTAKQREDKLLNIIQRMEDKAEQAQMEKMERCVLF